MNIGLPKYAADLAKKYPNKPKQTQLPPGKMQLGTPQQAEAMKSTMTPEQLRQLPGQQSIAPVGAPPGITNAPVDSRMKELRQVPQGMQPVGAPKTGQGGILNPALQGQQFVSQTPTIPQAAPQAQPNVGGGAAPFQGSFLNQLRQPGTFEQGLQTPVDIGQLTLPQNIQQGMYNLGRGQIQGGTRTAMEQMGERMGGVGFRGGESGIADTAMGKVAGQGAQQLGQFSSQLAINEAQRAQQAQQLMAQLNQQRLGMGMGGEMQRLLGGAGIQAQQAATGAAAGSAANQLAWQKERFGQEFPYQQEQDAMALMMQMYGGQQASQAQRYQPYWGALAQAYGS